MSNTVIMKNAVLSVLLLLFFVSISNAQEVKLNTPDVLTADTIWLNQKQKVCDKDTATFIRMATTNQSLDFIIKDYYLTGELYMTGKLSSQEPEVREGDFIWYYKDGKKKRLISYENSVRVKFKYWDVNGNEIKGENIAVEKMPQFPNGDKGLMEFVQSNLRYPKDAAQFKIQGTVVVRFTVDEKGNVTNPTVIRSVHQLLDSEALRVVKLLPEWKPGTSDGEPVKVYYTLPMMFRLKV